MGVGGGETNPPCLAFQAREEDGGETTPPSHISSEGGEWEWLADKQTLPVSHFKRERGMVEKQSHRLTFQVREGNGVGWQTNELSLSRISSKGGEWGWVVEKRTLPVSHFKRERGMRVVGRQTTPPHLVFRVREGDGGETTPPSHISSEEGEWRWLVDKRTLLISHFERGRGMGVDGGETTCPSRISSEGGEWR
jgi:hypothetical protein